jgi:8-oxoguanine DNA-glycosylase Ogg
MPDDEWKKFWCSEDSEIYQFIGEDNLYFYGPAQQAIWLKMNGKNEVSYAEGDLKPTNIIPSKHVLFLNKKASSSGSFKPPMAKDLLEHYTAEQMRMHFLGMNLGNNNVRFMPKPFNPDAKVDEVDVVLKEGNLLTNVYNRILRTLFYTIQKEFDGVVPVAEIDENLKLSIEYGNGIRILKQDIWEALISFIISANNNIPRIKGIIEKISKRYGREIKWNKKVYYTFPTPSELSKASIKDLRELGLGFRDSRVFETTEMVNNKVIDLEALEKIEDVNCLREQLLKFPGVGPKVADCVMLFSMKKHEVFPIDVWVKRVMTELYFEDLDKSEPNNKKILEFAEEKYGNLAGLAQQYLFFWRRELYK